MREVSVDITTVGANGAATGTAQMGVGGSVSTVKGLKIIYAATAPVTTVVVIANQGRNLLSAPASATTKYWMVKEQGFDNTGTAIAGQNGFDFPVVHGTVTATVTLSNALAPACTVVLFLDDAD